MVNTQKLTTEQEEMVRMAYAERQSFSHAARVAGVSRPAATAYLKSIPEDELDSFLQQKREEIIDKIYQVRVALIQEMMTPAKLQSATLKDLATSFGILTDKALLLAGKATERVETTTNIIDPSMFTPEQRKMMAELRERFTDGLKTSISEDD